MIIWNNLNISAEEERKIQELRNGGVGRKLTREQLEQFCVEREWKEQIDTEAGKTLVHFYAPKSSGKPLPLLINVHGGGFIKGRRDQDIVFCRNIGSQFGGIVADIDYVPAPNMRYPGQIYACYGVLQYLGLHGEKMGIDTQKIAMMGHSAGGTFTAASILMAINRGGRIPAICILDYACLDLKTPPKDKRNAREPYWKGELYNKMYVDPEQTSEVYCSPIQADDELLKKMPLTVMLYCESDTFCDENALFHERLIKAGVPVYGKRFLNSRHGFTVQRKDEYLQAEQMILNALNMMM